MMFLYLIFTMLVGSIMIVGILAMLILGLLERYRKKDNTFLPKVMTVAAGFIAGMVLAWIVAVFDMNWPLPFWETVYASGHSELYGHAMEHSSETIVLFVMFGGNIAALVTLISLWLTGVCRARRINIA
ncbi:MAG: hypothetical protein JXA73_25800 [Acidobacteria bacterium]|nr:hypothetical protein [Acidobacteriota bacterium]